MGFSFWELGREILPRARDGRYACIMRLFGKPEAVWGSDMRAEDTRYIGHVVGSLSTPQSTMAFAHCGSAGSGSESVHTSRKSRLSVPSPGNELLGM